MSKKLICFKHGDIISLCDELENLDLRKIKCRSRAKKIAKEIKKLCDSAAEDGQKMENRLNEYYSAIIGLGFKREK